MQYAQDYDEALPYGEKMCYGCALPPEIQPRNWCDSTFPTGAIGPMWMDAIDPYTKSTQLYRCPSGPGNEPGWASYPSCGLAPKDPRNMYSYTFNKNVLSQNEHDSARYDSTTMQYIGVWASVYNRRLSKFSRASELIVLSDRGRTDRATIQDGAADPTPGASDYATYGGNPSFRHLETTNFLYLDGHVKASSYGQFKGATDPLGATTL